MSAEYVTYRNVAAKRPRVALSCTQCRNRKVKCDKSKPCDRCTFRNETHLCEYEERSEAVQLVEMQRRVTELEHLIIHGQVTNTPPSRMTSVQGSTRSPQAATPVSTGIATVSIDSPFGPAANVEQALRTIDDLSEYAQNARPSIAHRPMSDMSPSAPSHGFTWPNILSHHPVNLRPARWLLDMQSNIKTIPDQDSVDVLVNDYFDRADFFWHHVHESVFRQEVDQFHRLRTQDKAHLVDPGWLALLIAVLIVAKHTSEAGDFTDVNKDPPFSPANARAPPSLLDEAFDSALLCAGALHTPQFRILQALVVVLTLLQINRPLALYEGVSIPASETFFLDLAISIVKSSRLHILGPGFERHPPADPAFPPAYKDLPPAGNEKRLTSGSTQYAREMSSRIVNALAIWDQVIGSIELDSARLKHDPQPFRFSPGSITTPRPSNIADCDLYPLSKAEVPSQPLSKKTEAIWEIHMSQIATLWCQISSLLRKDTNLLAKDIAQIDTDLQQGFGDLESMRANNYLSTKEDIIFEALAGSYNQRIIRLHRHHFLQSYSDDAFMISRAKTVSAARRIVRGFETVVARYGRQVPAQQANHFYSHTVSASVVLFVHGSLSPSDREGVKEELKAVLRLLGEARSQVSLRWINAIMRGYQIVHVLLKTLSNPPATVAEIELFLLDLRRRADDATASFTTACTGPPMLYPPVLDPFPGLTTAGGADFISQFAPTFTPLTGAAIGMLNESSWPYGGHEPYVPKQASPYLGFKEGDLQLQQEFNWDSLFSGF